jgi:hypothetical protein
MACSPTEIAAFYAEAFRHYDRERQAPPVNVQFYPYVGINHTIRIRSGQAYVRIAELCREMPAEQQRSLAYILVSKLYRRRPPRWMRELYGDFIKSDAIRERTVENRRQRGRKVVSGTKGSVFDLDDVFDRLNETYFNGELEKPALTWSTRKTFRILGHHDSTHKTIVISRSLDTPDTPRFVVEYVMFHEMLHVHHPTVHHNGRRYNHTAAFRRDEEAFEHYHAAERWIENNVRRLKRAAKRK